jgi:PAS domain-containing protein
MQVKQKLQLNSTISVVAGFVIVLVLVFAAHFIIQAVETSTATENIITSSYEMITLRNDYVESFNERAKVQWFSKHEEISQLLKSASEKSRDPANQAILAELTKDHKSIGSIFSVIVTNRGIAQDRASMGELSQETEKRLLTQLTTKNYDLVLNARMLQTTSRKALFSVLFRTASGIVSFLILVFAGVIINSLFMGRSITERIKTLGEGAKMLGNGNLDLRIAIKGNDEFAELSTAFNVMTGKLNDSYHTLHKEITERKQTEEALKQSEERLALATTGAGIGIFEWQYAGKKVLWTPQMDAIFGYSPEFTTTTTTTYDYRHWADRVHPEDLQRVEEEARRCMDERKVFDNQYREAISGAIVMAYGSIA